MKILKYILLAMTLFVSSSYSKSILEMYRGSSQERLLDAQIQAYRGYAIKNAKTFGREYSNVPNYNRHVGLNKLRKVLPNHVNRDNIPEWRTKKGVKQPPPKLNDLSKIKSSAYTTRKK